MESLVVVLFMVMGVALYFSVLRGMRALETIAAQSEEQTAALERAVSALERGRVPDDDDA